MGDIYKIIGSTGLKKTGGYVTEEWHRRLQGNMADRVYREMADNSSAVGSFIFAIKSLIRHVEWRLEPADDSKEAAQQAEFVEGCLDDMSQTWDDFLVEALSHLTYGYAFHEVVYKLRRGPDHKDPKYKSKYSDGKVGWRKLPLRSHDTLEDWVFDEDGGIRGRWQMDPYCSSGVIAGPVFIPIEKALLFRTEATRGNPEGRSVLRNAVRPWWFQKRLEEIEAIGIERDMSGYPVFEVPPRMLMASASSDERALIAQLEKMVQEIKRDEREGAIIPSELDEKGMPTGFKFRLVSSGGRRQVDTSGVIERYERQILMAVIADFLKLGHDKVGSFAMMDIKTELFALALGAVMDSIAEVFNRFAIPRLMRLNKTDPDLDPSLTHGDIKTPDLEKTGKFLESLASTGVLGSDTALERKMREIGSLPQED